MKLSEAIRLGSMVTEQAQGVLINADGRTCALGAAGIAVGVFSKEKLIGNNWIILIPIFPILEKQVHHPVFGYIESLYTVIVCLNDGCKWTREQIANWVEKCEMNTISLTESKASLEGVIK